ncbi:MAG TPA: pseudouridine synthase [Bacteroidota bacterium]
MKRSRYHYIIFFKPYGVLSQFTDGEGRQTLGDFGPFPKEIYPVGRLDRDSEGLLLLTDDNGSKHHLTDPGFGHERTYLVQVERAPSNEALRQLRSGVIIEGKRTRPAKVRLLENEPNLPDRAVPIRFRKTVPTAWLEITLTEGRNRQVRKMTAAVGHPTLRLVRIRLGSLSLEGLSPGKSRPLTDKETGKLLGIISRK